MSIQQRQKASAPNIDLERWRRVASEETKEGWHDRARLAAAFLRPADIVCDLGAGSQPLKSYLPEGALIEATISFWAVPDHVALEVTLNEKSPAG